MKKVKNILLPYEKKWVAISKDNSQVVASGNSIKEVEKKVKKLKEKDIEILYVTPFDQYLTPLCK